MVSMLSDDSEDLAFVAAARSEVVVATWGAYDSASDAEIAESAVARMLEAREKYLEAQVTADSAAQEFRDAAARMVLIGYSLRETARRCGVSHTAVRQWTAEYVARLPVGR